MRGHCDKCANPGIPRQGAPRGSITSYQLPSEAASTDVYVTGEGDDVIVLCTDIFGIKYNNTLLLADDYAERCHTRVLVPDYLYGDPMDSTLQAAEFRTSFQAWLKTKDIQDSIRITNELVSHLIEKELVTAVCVIGFCWGAPSVCSVAQRNASQIKAAAIAHPSRSQHFDPTLITRPLHICAAEDDEAFPITLAERWASSNERIRVSKHLKCTHGFVCRPVNDVEKTEATKAVEITAAFFIGAFRT